jgi:hypothetical protein
VSKASGGGPVATRVSDTSSSSTRRGSVTFVGTGISLVGHVTLETVEHIKAAEKLIYLVAEPAAAAWLHGLNPSAESLADCYVEGRMRERSYEEMVERILVYVQAGRRVCVAFYGHPGIGVDPTHMIMARARTDGFTARVLPGISADACLFADLEIDPLDAGYQGYEASTFIARRPRIDTSSGLILWQIGFVCEPSIKFSGESSKKGVRLLARTLSAYYRSSQKIVIYEASLYPVCKPVIVRTTLRELPRAFSSAASTLYVPPATRSPSPPAARQRRV